jgi:hypothetical protein
MKRRRLSVRKLELRLNFSDHKLLDKNHLTIENSVISN